MRYDGRDEGKTLGKMNSWLIIGVLALYIVLLFICAFFGEKHASRLSTRGRMLLFSLTLGVYCSSWTFYGATGAAVREGIIFLPIYLGPLLFVALGYDIWRRLGRVRQHHAISSIADFVAARYGKSGPLASMVTILAVIAIIPYLALQLRAIALSAAVILEPTAGSIASTTNGVLFLTGILAILAMILEPTDCQYRTTWRSDVSGCLRVFCQTVCFAVCRTLFCVCCT
jgi:Na+/proline symporter